MARGGCGIGISMHMPPVLAGRIRFVHKYFPLRNFFISLLIGIVTRAPSAMGLEPSAAYLEQTETLPGGHVPVGIFRAKHGYHPIFRGMRNLVRKLSGSRTGGPMPPRGAEEATRMYRRATLAATPQATNNAAADTELDADGDCVADGADSEGRGHVPKLIAEKQARLRRASRLLSRTHGSP
ncbi:hypothetical protein CSHISOI_01289 [Colletotrichum shisoi]|uniref:Uncharacterized protein n=1 Tax=Colletotrichum shisoi TaxID=2078593 RepID=A0A5Q4C5M6_9PEZI|nr:hypothetical protein CSHISOI_01289 [Colletotrichum shisoi]